MSRARRLGAPLAVLACATLLTSCVQVPHNGPVVEAKPQVQDNQAQQPFNNPPPPKAGASPDDIVLGFLEAMTATPLNPAAASEYLTKQGRAEWNPQRVFVFGRRAAPTGTKQVVLPLRRAARIGAAGNWEGAIPPTDARIRFTMAHENGEWRIAHAPDALILQADFYDANYEDASLYYFDPTGRILVPEPVHVPQGSQLASSLVKALLRAPRSLPRSVTQTFIPPGLSIGISVPVNRGVAEVNLTGTDPGPLDRIVIKRMLAQLAWTLQQDTTIKAFTLTIAGRPVTDGSGASRFPVRTDQASPIDPTVPRASGQIYALRRGRLVSGQVALPTPVGGPFGTHALGIGPFAVNLHNTKVAGVQPDALLVGPVLGTEQPISVLSGTGLLRPTWDFADRLWEVQNGAGGAVVEYLPNGTGSPHRIRVPGITHEQVRRFLVSRDGSRMVAVLRGAHGDRIVVSRLRYDADGKAIGATRARRIPWRSAGTTRIRDIGWTSPTTIAVLDQVSPQKAEVRILGVDGSTRPAQAPPTQVTGRVSGVATAAGQTPYAVLQSGLSNISPDQVQTRLVPTVGLRHVSFAG